MLHSSARTPLPAREICSTAPIIPGRGATIVLSITHGFQARNLLQTDVARLLLDAGYRLLIVSPAADDAGFRESLGLPSEARYVVARAMPGRLANLFATVRRYALANPRRNSTYNLFNEKYRNSRKLQYILLRRLNQLAGRFPALRRLWTRLEAVLISGRSWEPILREADPVLLVTGTPGTEYLDALLLRCARRLRIPSLCVVLSWDNLTSKGYMAAVPDHLVVWNERMRDEAVELHDFAPSAVEVAGVAHFDIYQQVDSLLSREQVCARLGLQADRPIVLFGTVSPFLFDYNHEVAQLVAEAASDGRIQGDAQLVIRLHPQSASPGPYGDVHERYRELQRRFCRTVSLDIPHVAASRLQWALPREDMRWLASLLRHSDVLLNVASTLAIDAALAGTPVIGVAFDGAQSLPYERSIRRAYDYTHYHRIVATGGVPLAHSLPELIEQVNRYLMDPTLDADGRRRIAIDQAWRLDGRSGQRVAVAIAAFAARRSPASSRFP
jgi:hypothetical protein